MPYITTEVEVEVDLVDFDTEDLIEELENRGHGLDSENSKDTLYSIWLKRRNNQDYQRELDVLIWDVLGKIA
jgi:hypothetical protein